MSQEINYGETTSDKIKKLIESWDKNSVFGDVYYGEPDDVSETDLPFAAVDLLDTTIAQGPTATDLVTQTIKIIIAVNKKDGMSDFDDETVGWKKQLELRVEGIDPVTGQYDPTTIMGIMRKNFTMGNYALNQNVKIKYGEVFRAGIEEPSSGEAHITLSIDHHQYTPAKI